MGNLLVSGEALQIAINKLKGFGNTMNIIMSGSGLNSNDKQIKMEAVFNGS
jgi:hypothetical protein